MPPKLNYERLNHGHQHDGCCDHDHPVAQTAEPISTPQAIKDFSWQLAKGLFANHADHNHKAEEGYRGITTRKWSYAAAGGTAVAGVAQTVGGALSGISAAIVAGTHDALDSLPLFWQSKNTQTESAHDHNAHNRASLARNVSFAAALGSLAYAGLRLSGHDLLSDNENRALLNAELAIAGGALAINSLIAYRPLVNSYKKIKDGLALTHHDHDLKDHVSQDVVTSVAALSAAVLSIKGMQTEAESLGAASSALVAYRFLPYKIAKMISSAKTELIKAGPSLNF